MAFIAAVATNTDAFETSCSTSIDVGSGSNRYVVGFVGQSTDTTADITSATQITLGGSSTGVTLAGAGTSPALQAAVIGRWFYIAVPSGTTGTQTLAVNAGAGSTSRKIWLNAASYSGITGVRSSGYGSNTYDATPTATPSSSATGDEVLLFTFNAVGGLTITPGTGASSLTGGNGGTNATMWALRKDGASSVTIGGTWASSQEYCTAYFSLQAAAPPTAPTIGSPSNVMPNSVRCNWTDNSSDETGFKVEYSVSPYSSWTSAGTASAGATYYDVTGLSEATTYKLRVCATNAAGDSSFSTQSDTFTTKSWSYVRPASDITKGWSASTGTDHYALLDESTASDTDYIYAASAALTDEIKLGPMSTPQAGTSLAVNYRVQGVAAGATVTAYLYCGATLIYTDTTRTANGDYTMTVPSTSWDTEVTDWTDMRIRFVSG